MPPESSFVGSYDFRLVALSILIAIVASYAALDLGGRVTAATGRRRLVWLTGGAVAMGMGIWSMHYIGMLAYNLPIPVEYDWPTVAWSFLAAVLASAIALFVVSRTAMGPISVGVGGLFMGAGIAGMHYIGMEAMRLPAMCHYSIPVVSLSIVLAIAISIAGLWLTFHLRFDTAAIGWRKLSSALLMGSAIPIMHYTGMAAVSFTLTAAKVDLSHAIGISALGTAGITCVSMLVLALAILTSLVDRRFAAQSLQLQMSEQRYRQLVESAQIILWKADLTTNAFSYINKKAQDLFGYSVDEWLARPGFMLQHVPLEDQPLMLQSWSAVADNRGPQQLEHRMIAADGKTLWLKTSLALLADDGKHELVGVMADITARKEAQEAAEAAHRSNIQYLTEIERLNSQLMRDNSRMSAELEITRRLQKMMLPREEELQTIGNLDISGFMEPAADVGGDYYDIVSQKGGVVLSIGDVTGHGLESGVIAIMVQTAVRTLLAIGVEDSHKFLEVLNKVIYDNVRKMNCDRNLTFTLLRYQDKLVTVSGQHEEILVVRRTGVLERHDTLDLGFPLGLERDISTLISETTFPLSSGDVLVVYTDGITEAINSAGVTYGIERLTEALTNSHAESAQRIRDTILESLRKYVEGETLRDDVSLLVVKPA